MSEIGAKGDGLSRRAVLAGAGMLAAGSAAVAVGSFSSTASASPGWINGSPVIEVEYLRRLYGQATDLLGPGADRAGQLTESQRRELGRSIYHRIFTPDAVITDTGSPPVIGPDNWADFVTQALSPFSATQHLFGTQIVTMGRNGEASMQSYLSALLQYSPGGDILGVRGTYFDKVRLTSEGWKIYDMSLVTISVELREHS